MRPTVYDTDFSVVSPERDETILVDMIIIHGLQGHPRDTWLYKGPPTMQRESQASTRSSKSSFLRKLGLKKNKAGEGAKSSQHAEDETAQSDTSTTRSEKNEVYWPTDLLAPDCPRARIMVWGYDTMVTRGPGKAANKDGLFAHGLNLLYALSRQRQHGRPIIFVAHSLGGILVKELLTHADASEERELLDIAESTSAVVFLGTPHRGSGAAQLADIARQLASALLMDTNGTILDALGLQNEDLVRCQHSFARIWEKRRFRLKTFQENRPLTGLNVGKLNKLIVPNISSQLGLPNEYPETLDADHKTMCKFKDLDDPNYRKVGGELVKLYRLAVETVDNVNSHRSIAAGTHAQSLDIPPSRYSLSLTSDNLMRSKARSSLVTERFELRERDIDPIYPGTGKWLLYHETYRDWLTRRDVSANHGLLWLNGRPGSGKSVLMKFLANTCAAQTECPESTVAKFYFDARNSVFDQTSMKGFVQALLFQLLPLCTKTFDSLVKAYQFKVASRHGSGAESAGVIWETGEVQNMIKMMFGEPRKAPIYVFVDALDECEHAEGDQPAAKSIGMFLRKLTDIAYDAKSNLNICMSSRRQINVSYQHCAEINIDLEHHEDIQFYINQELAVWSMPDWLTSQKAEIRDAIVAKSEGIFLWAKLALGFVTDEIDGGFQINLNDMRSNVSTELGDLYGSILRKRLLTVADKLKASRLFQWALLAQRPLSAAEWFHVMAFINKPYIRSIAAWRNSREGIIHVHQLARRVRALSGGLLEVALENGKAHSVMSNGSSSRRSISAYAGSMRSFDTERPVVQFTHQSVREYFLVGSGFQQLGHSGSSEGVRNGHLYILQICLNYACLKEMALVVAHSDASSSLHLATKTNRRTRQARNHQRPPVTFRSRWPNASGSHISVVSFGSSAASSTRRSSNGNQEISKAEARESFASDEVIASQESANDIVGREELNNGRVARLLRWIEDIVATKQPTPLEPLEPAFEKHTNPHLTQTPAPAKQITIDETPSLRLYAIDMFAHHAVAAQSVRASPGTLLRKIENERNISASSSRWYKWCQISEETDLDTTPAYFAAEWDLLSWINWYIAHPLAHFKLREFGGELRSPLLIALARGHETIVTRLLPYINLDNSDSNGWTIEQYLMPFDGGEEMVSQMREDPNAVPRATIKRLLRGFDSSQGRWYVELIRYGDMLGLRERLQPTDSA